MKKEGNELQTTHTYGVHITAVFLLENTSSQEKTIALGEDSCQQGHGRFYHPHALVDGIGKPISSKVGFESYSTRPILIEIVRIQNFKMSI